MISLKFWGNSHVSHIIDTNFHSQLQPGLVDAALNSMKGQSPDLGSATYVHRTAIILSFYFAS